MFLNFIKFYEFEILLGKERYQRMNQKQNDILHIHLFFA